MPVRKISKEEIDKIKQRSVLNIPDNASEKGLNSNEVKNAIVEPTLIVVEMVNRVINDMNTGELEGNLPTITYKEE